MSNDTSIVDRNVYMKTTEYETTLYIYEKTMNDDFCVTPRIYIRCSSNENEAKCYSELIWQAIEIEGFDNTEILVEAVVTKNGEYLDRDEFAIKTNVVRGNVPSRYVQLFELPAKIFCVDMEKSSIECLDF